MEGGGYSTQELNTGSSGNQGEKIEYVEHIRFREEDVSVEEIKKKKAFF